MQLLAGTLTHYANPQARPELEYSSEQRDILSVANSQQAIKDISQWPGYSVTPLHELNAISAEIGGNKFGYKDESQRFGLRSFKALGGAYAVQRAADDAPAIARALSCREESGHSGRALTSVAQETQG